MSRSGKDKDNLRDETWRVDGKSQLVQKKVGITKQHQEEEYLSLK